MTWRCCLADAILVLADLRPMWNPCWRPRKMYWAISVSGWVLRYARHAQWGVDLHYLGRCQWLCCCMPVGSVCITAIRTWEGVCGGWWIETYVIEHSTRQININHYWSCLNRSTCKIALDSVAIPRSRLEDGDYKNLDVESGGTIQLLLLIFSGLSVIGACLLGRWWPVKLTSRSRVWFAAVGTKVKINTGASCYPNGRWIGGTAGRVSC